MINGKRRPDAVGKTLAAFLASEGYRTDRVVVEYNGKIPDRSRYGEIVIAKEDRIEIVHFVGGG
ncbi:MAG: sulfur carrier protein ThiS [Eubacteriales bacterium]|nr:sulfur carrier protein ThiS [Eubacteriales bacterium]